MEVPNCTADVTLVAFVANDFINDLVPKAFGVIGNGTILKMALSIIWCLLQNCSQCSMFSNEPHINVFFSEGFFDFIINGIRNKWQSEVEKGIRMFYILSVSSSFGIC